MKYSDHTTIQLHTKEVTVIRKCEISSWWSGQKRASKRVILFPFFLSFFLDGAVRCSEFEVKKRFRFDFFFLQPCGTFKVDLSSSFVLSFFLSFLWRGSSSDAHARTVIRSSNDAMTPSNSNPGKTGVHSTLRQGLLPHFASVRPTNEIKND